MLLTEYDEARALEIAKKEARDEGREEGRTEGESKLGALMARLMESGRMSDAYKAASDPGFREKMYTEFSMA